MEETINIEGLISQIKKEREAEELDDLRKEMVDGLLYSHRRVGANTSKILEATSFLYAAIEILVEKGILTLEELDEKNKIVKDRLVGKFAERGMGAVFADPEEDKYNFEGEAHVDCEGRVHICKAACCRLFTFALSKQDLKEGIIKWDLGEPYLIAKDKDGYCIHLDKDTYRCKIWENRPVACRAFDCRNKDPKIWLDFDSLILNPELPELMKSSMDALLKVKNEI